MMARLGAAIGILMIVGIGVWAAVSPGGECEIACYVTSLRGRTQSQVFNAALAAKRVDNTVVEPNHVFSFLKTVGPWTADQGYEKAPVSYDGELVRSWGGGVCQVSTTLYNAVLLAGLEMVERHSHHWPARYAPLGRDAAVAYGDIDLRFRNNLPASVRIIGRIEGDNLVIRIMSKHKPAYKVRIEAETWSVTAPNEVVQDRTADHSGRWRLINRGHPGFYVTTYRRFISQDGGRRELLAEDYYPAMNRIVRVTER